MNQVINPMKNFLPSAYIIGKNELILQLRNPLWLFFGLFQPIVYLVLFSPFLSGITQMPGFPAINAIQFFAPGLLIMNVLFGAAFAGFGLIDKLRSGFIERIRVTPVSRLAIVLGLVLRSPVVLLVQSGILVLTALLYGLQIHIVGMLILAVLLSLIGITMASLSYTIALIVREEGALAAVTNFFTLPLFILAGVMLPVTFAPPLIQHIAKFNPFAYGVNAARALVNGNIGDSSVWAAFIIFAVLGSLALSWFIRKIKDAVA
jgi:ABC-2 type transport system permease protein